MKKQIFEIAIFLTAFLFGTATTNLAVRVNAAAGAAAYLPEEEIRATAQESFVNVADDQAIYGWYTLDKYIGMDEVTMIYISDPGTSDDEPSGGVFTNFESYGDQGFFNSSRTKVNGNHVEFLTETIKGISYKFEGTFIYRTVTEGEKPLYGTLQKFVKGKKVAETSGNFEYAEPRCWH